MQVTFNFFLKNTQFAQESTEICYICAKGCNTPVNLFIFADHN